MNTQVVTIQLLLILCHIYCSLKKKILLVLRDPCVYSFLNPFPSILPRATTGLNSLRVIPMSDFILLLHIYVATNSIALQLLKLDINMYSHLITCLFSLTCFEDVSMLIHVALIYFY